MFNMQTSGTSSITNKFLSRMFRKIDGLVIDISTGTIGLKDSNGIYTLNMVAGEIIPGVDATAAVAAVAATADNIGTAAVAATPGTPSSVAKPTFEISVNPFDTFGMSVPAFATQVPFEGIKIKDIIVGDKGILGWVIDKKAASLVLLDQNGYTKQYSPPKVAIGGSTGVLVVQSMFGLGGDGFGSLQGSLLPLMMMMGDDTSALDSMLPMILFSQSQGSGASNSMASMMPMLMMSQASKGNGKGMDPMMAMMMMGGMGGAGAAGGMNPMMMAMMLGKDDAPAATPQLSRLNSAPALQKLNSDAASNGVSGSRSRF